MRAAASHSQRRIRGFTLLELILAGAAALMILSVILNVYWRALHLRNQVNDRTHEARLQARAASIIRNDLRGGRLSGGALAASLEGSATSIHSSFPGDLRFTTTTANATEDELAADVQEIEYYIASDSSATDGKSGVLIRAVNRNLLSQVQEVAREETILSGVESMEVAFYDGYSWQDSWSVTSTDTDITVPKEVRVRVHLAAAAHDASIRNTLEVTVPWSTDLAVTPVATSTATAATTP